MQFQLYDFIGLSPNQKLKTVIKELDKVDSRIFFIREILENGEYICDVYLGENLIEKHYITTLPIDSYEKKDIKATYKIREYYPTTATWIDNPRIFGSITEIENAVTNGEVTAQFWEVWGLSIYCNSDCKKFGIDPSAPWPPKTV